MNIEINDDMVAEIVATELGDSIECFEEALVEGDHAVFSYDKEEEREMLQKYIEAFNLVKDWYCV